MYNNLRTQTLIPGNELVGVGTRTVGPLRQGIPTQGLVASYLLNGNASAEVGTNGTATNVTWVDSEIGYQKNMGSFNGTSSWISTPNISGLQFGTGSFAISLWFKTTATSQQILFRKDLESQSPRRLYGININYAGGSNKVCGECYSNGTQPLVQSSKIINDGLWHHVVFVRTPTQQLLYVDGKLDASLTRTAVDISSTGIQAIGRYTESVGAFFNGSLGLLRVYNRVLTQNEVTALYLEGLSKLH